MDEQTLLPSSNWFLPGIASCSGDGTLVYGSRNCIVVIRSIEREPNKSPAVKPEFIYLASRMKVTAVSFCNRDITVLPQYPLAAACEDGSVAIWDIKTLKLLQRQEGHTDAVTCLAWTQTGELLLVYGDEKGKITVWDVGAKCARSLAILPGSKLLPYSLACNPVNQNIVAVGCKDGLICILNVKGQGTLLNKIRAHDKAVVSLSWQPGQGSTIPPLLASGGLDMKFNIWKTTTGQCVKSVTLPTKKFSKGFKSCPDTNRSNAVAWLPLLWLKNDLLLTASRSSELLAWNPLSDDTSPKLLHAEHLRGLFCIAAPPLKENDENWRAAEEPYVVWTLAQDRALVYAKIIGTKNKNSEPQVTETCTEVEDVEEIPPTEKQEELTSEVVAKDQPSEEVVAENQPSKEVVVENQLSKEVVVENQPSEKEVAENQLSKEGIVENQPSKEVVVENQLSKEVVVENQPSEKEVAENQLSKEGIVENQPSKEVVVENQPSKEVVVENQPSEEVVAENQPSEEEVAENQLSKEVIVENQPSKEVVVENQPSEEVVVENQPSKEVVVENQPSEEVVAENQPSEEVVADDQPSEEVVEKLNKPMMDSDLEDTQSEVSLAESVPVPTESEEKCVEKTIHRKGEGKKKSNLKKVQNQAADIINFPTIGGFVYFLSTCPFVPGRVAMGLGDETIRIWKMLDTNTINMKTIWQRIKGKVMALAWHPENEGILAFGTDGGRVGFININLNNEPTICRLFTNNVVYRVAWGPPVYKKDNTATDKPAFVLYACDSKNSFYYNPKQPDNAPVQLKPIIKKSNPNISIDCKHTELAWKSDFSLLAIGLADGCVQLFSPPNLDCVHTILAHKKTIQFIAWHPLDTATSYNCVQQHWLATASTEHHLNIFDTAPLNPDKKGEPWKKLMLPLEPFAELKHKGGKVVSLSWNPHISGQIASSSYDKTVKVWDVERRQLIAEYSGHSGCVLSCCWSTNDADVMLSGSSDYTVRTWNISKYAPVSELHAEEPVKPVDAPAESSDPVIVRVQNEWRSSTESVQKPISNAAAQAKKRITAKNISNKFQTAVKSHMFPVSGRASYDKECAMACCNELLMQKGVLPRKAVDTNQANGSVQSEDKDNAVENGSCQSEDKDNAVENGSCQSQDKENNDNVGAGGDNLETKEETAIKVPEQSISIDSTPNIGYFTSKENFSAMLDTDGAALEKAGTYHLKQQLDLWRGNLPEVLKSCAQLKRLDDWLVSLASSVSHKMWLEMCAAYANQLAEKEEYIKAVSYYLVCHKVMEALDLLQSKKMYREAAVLCRCRLGSDDPIYKEIMLEWAKASVNLGSYELAAQCYISCEDYNNAASVLSKRGDVRLRKLATLLAKQSGNTALQAALASDCLTECLMEEKFEDAEDILSHNEDIQPLLPLIGVHKMLVELSKEDPPTKEELTKLWSIEKEQSEGGQSLLDKIAELIKEDGLYEKLVPLLALRSQLPENRKELLIITSRLLLLAAAGKKDGNSEWEKYIILALHMNYKHGLVCVKQRPLHYVLHWLGCPILENLKRSETSYICAVMLDCLSKDDPSVPALLFQFKETLLDSDAALFSRLTVMVNNLEREAAKAVDSGSEAQEELDRVRSKIRELEKERVSFPNAMVMMCKLQNLVQNCRDNETMGFEEIETWASDLDKYRELLQK